jgi:hypothetical protein
VWQHPIYRKEHSLDRDAEPGAGYVDQEGGVMSVGGAAEETKHTEGGEGVQMVGGIRPAEGVAAR